MIPRRFRFFGIAAALASVGITAHAQQLIPGLTGPECSARSGSIRTWTSTAGIYPQRGECYVPPRVRGGSRGGGGGGGSNAASTLGAAAGVLGGVAGVLGTLAEIEEARKERERQWLQELQDQREFNREHTAATEQELLRREQARRAREQAAAGEDAQASAQARASVENPFAAASASSAPGGFKTDGQIKSECAQSGNPGMCELALSDARARDPAYQQWKASESARLDENVRRSKAEVDRLNSDPDLAKCREGSSAPWTIAGCYDLKGQPQQASANPNALRDQLRRSLRDADTGGAAESEADVPRVADTPRPPAVAAPAEAAPTLASSAWPQAPWRTRDERACREAGGVLVNPSGAGDLTGIPQVVLDNPDVPRAQVASTPYCNPVPNMSPAENATAVRALTTPP